MKTLSIQLGMAAMAWSMLAGVQATAATGAYPTRPITFMVPQAVGGSTDTLAREIGMRLSTALGQPVVIDNRAGANGIIGSDLVAKAAPDGYTLLIGGSGTMAINATLYPKLPYNPVKDFVPVGNFGYSTSMLTVNPALPVKNLRELIALLKAQPGKISYASAGIGSSPHLTTEMFRQMTGTEILHVPYKGSTPGVNATVAGETQMMFTGVTSAIGQVKADRLRVLAITGTKRSPALPDVPSSTEAGLPGFEADFWIGLFAPAGTPEPIIRRLNTEVNRILNAPEMQAKFDSTGVSPVPGTPEQFGQTQRKDIDRWAKIIKSAGLQAQ